MSLLHALLLAATLTGPFALAQAPPLRAGEGLARRTEAGLVEAFGESCTEAPMGSLAKLIWLRLEGTDWFARGVEFHCTGSWNGVPCWNRQGHGRLDLDQALRDSCNLAFLAWARESLTRHLAIHGEDWTRARLLSAFRPFLGRREPERLALPEVGSAWVGDGELLRTSPEVMLRWLQAPEQSSLLTFLHAHLEPEEGWWMKTGTAPVLGHAGFTSAWVAGGNGACLAVLHLPAGRGKAEGLARFRALLLDVASEEPLPQPLWIGDPEDLARLEAPLEAAFRGTADYGAWPPGPWRVQLHPEAASFERATGAPPQRASAWVGSTLHLRPWDQLKRRDLGGLFRHELVHRRLAEAGLHRWEEEARCLWAEGHVRPPAVWPAPPETLLQTQLDLALARGSTERQAWAYAWLRAWMEGRSTPPRPEGPEPSPSPWTPLPIEDDRVVDAVRVTWPEARMPARMEVNGAELVLPVGTARTFKGRVKFGAEAPVPELEGRVDLRRTALGWRLSWTVEAETWIAAAIHGEMGQGPFEAKRALAAVLRQWLKGHREDQHEDGSLCPLTHCAVLRELPTMEDRRAAREAPAFDLDPRWAFFTASAGGHALSPRAVWGRGPQEAGPAFTVTSDAWATWERRLSASQVQRLKGSVRPGLRPGQLGLRLGLSGPYAVEQLRLTAGRLFGWTAWPSNACEAEPLPDGGMVLRGHGWGHNAGLCLATTMQRSREGWTAERILEATFPPPFRGKAEAY